MGLFDDLFSSFTGDPQQQAAADQRKFLGGVYNNISADNNRAAETGRVMAEYGKDNSTSALQGGIKDARSALQTGTNQGISTLESAYGNDYRSSAQMAADAQGLNGPAGVARARAAFQTGPGYEFALEQGLNSVARGANAAGMVASGNQLQESQRFGQGLADQEFDQWLTGVRGRESLYAPLYGKGIADLQAGHGRNLATLEAEGGRSQAGIYDTFAQRSGAYPMQAAQLNTNLGSALAGRQSDTFMNAANAQTQGSQNIWNAIGNAASAAFDFIF